MVSFKPKKYWIRVIGWFLSFGGIGLIVDEVIQGVFKIEFPGHELYDHQTNAIITPDVRRLDLNRSIDLEKIEWKKMTVNDN